MAVAAEPAYILRDEEGTFESLAAHLKTAHGIRRPPNGANHQDLLHIHHVLSADDALYYALRPVERRSHDGYPMRKIVERRPIMRRVGGRPTGGRSRTIGKEAVVVSSSVILRLECGCEVVRQVGTHSKTAACRREDEHKRYPGRIYPPERLPKFMVAT